jgi:hypothetical protein
MRDALMPVWIVALALFAACTPAQAQSSWSLSSNGRGEWSSSAAMPAIYKQVSPNGTDDTAAINAALASCPDGEAVQLTTGLFKISGDGVIGSHCSLIGSGSGQQQDVGGPTCPNGALVTVGGYSYCTDSTATQLIRVDSVASPVITFEDEEAVSIQNMFVWGALPGPDIVFRACVNCSVSAIIDVYMQFEGLDPSRGRHPHRPALDAGARVDGVAKRKSDGPRDKERTPDGKH